MKNLNKIIPVGIALKIAESQKDLGLSSKKKMVLALSCNDEAKRVAAYEQLDTFTLFIVDAVLEGAGTPHEEDEEQIELNVRDAMKYHVSEMQNIVNALK